MCTQHLVSQLLTHSGNIVCKLQALFHATKSGIGVIFREYLLSYLAEGSQKHTQRAFFTSQRDFVPHQNKQRQLWGQS